MSDVQQIVVGVDGSEVATEAVRFAAAEAKRRACGLQILHAGDAVTVSGEPSGTEQVRPFLDILREEAVTAAAQVAGEVPCEFLMRTGDAADALLEVSKGAVMVVVGTHRMGRLRGFVLGSVSQRVAAHALVPVVTISGPTADGSGPLVLAASSSEGGLAAMRVACTEAQLRGVPVHAIRAATIEDWTNFGFGYPVATTAEALRDNAQAQLDKVVATAAEEFPDVKIEAELTMADAFTALATAAQTASLLVLGSRRPDGAPLAHLGPVAAWLLHQAQCPLVVVPYISA